MQNVVSLTMILGTIVDEDEQEVEQTTTALVNTDLIRCVYARKDNRPGTRITFSNGRGFAVQENYDEVVELIRG
jgi:uncharacterized protein YlzI (FlbEa/FlbD family)